LYENKYDGGEVRTFLRYLLFQIPQWLILAIFLWLLVDATAVPRWVSIAFFIFWVVKDFAMYPFVRRAYEKNTKTGTQELIGSKGVTHEALAPEGYIKIHGELWKARSTGETIAENRKVRVTGARGLTLIVEAENGAGGVANTGHSRPPKS